MCHPETAPLPFVCLLRNDFVSHALLKWMDSPLPTPLTGHYSSVPISSETGASKTTLPTFITAK